SAMAALATPARPSVSRPSERKLLRLLQQAELREADGLAVRVTEGAGRRREGADQGRIRYAVPPLPGGGAWAAWARGRESLESYATAVGEELHGWATEHVRRHRPLPPPDLEEVARSLPGRDELWQELRSGFREVEDDGAGFQGVLYGKLVEVTFGADDW